METTKAKRHWGRITGKAAITVVLMICGISCLLPLAWMISTSFKPELDVFEYPIRWIPTSCSRFTSCTPSR